MRRVRSSHLTKAASLSVQIAVDKPTIVPGETALLKATATGGVPPFAFTWTGPAEGAADQLAFTADKPGTQAFTVTVSDSKGATATASASVTIEAPTVMIRRTTPGTVVLGLPFGFQAQVSSAGKPLPGPFVLRWEPHPAVTYAPHEGAATQTTAVFTRPGRTLVWVDVLRQEGPVLVTLAESEQIEIDVVGPELSLTANPSTPYPGQEVRVNVTMNPAIQDKYVTFWWELQGNALNAGPVVVGDAYSRAYTYKPKDTGPVTVTVHGKSKDGGEDLGEKSISVTARPYEVKIGEPRLMGPPPRVWSEQAKSLVEVPRAIGTFQEFFVNASISPPPPDSPLRYEWKSQPEGCSIYSPGSQETRSSASQPGSFNISVTVRDNQGITLGSGERTVSIVAPAPEQKPAAADALTANRELAAQKLKQAYDFNSQGKIDEGLALSEEALRLDPNERARSRLYPIFRASNHLQRRRSWKAGRLEEAGAEIAAAKELYPTHGAIPEYERRIQELVKQRDAAGAAAAQQNAAKTEAADKVKQAYAAAGQGKVDEAVALSEEALRLDPDNPDAARYVRFFRASQHIVRVIALGKAGRLDEASAEIAEAKKDEPAHPDIPKYEQWVGQLVQQRSAAGAAAEAKKAEAARQSADRQAAAQAAKQAATDHLTKALELGKAGRIDEAAAEVAEAKKDDVAHSRIPEFEKWIQSLIQQRNAANAAAAAKKTEEADRQASAQAATQAARAAEQRAAEERAREEAAPGGRRGEKAARFPRSGRHVLERRSRAFE